MVRLLPLIYVTCGLGFVLGLYRNDPLAYGIVYPPLIATAVVHKNRLGLWIMTTLACIMMLAEPLIAPGPPHRIESRILAILAILTTAAFVHHARDTQDRLTAETRRAEAAERIKADVLTTLCREIPPSFHALLGVLTLTMATSRPDQREALLRVRSDGRHLLAMIENLLDLTQINEHELQQQTIDMASIARDAAEKMRLVANERQVSIALDPDWENDMSAAIGDRWAMRRILDNLLDNAVRITPPGGTVSVSVARDADTVTTSISDSGIGLPPTVAQDFHDGTLENEGPALPGVGGIGLALSNRLARAMNGRLIARNLPSRGAMVSLSLPAA